MEIKIELLDGNTSPYSKIKAIVSSKSLDDVLELIYTVNEDGSAKLLKKADLPEILIQEELEFADEEIDSFLKKETYKYFWN